jgi:hypothetical protein
MGYVKNAGSELFYWRSLKGFLKSVSYRGRVVSGPLLAWVMYFGSEC